MSEPKEIQHNSIVYFTSKSFVLWLLWRVFALLFLFVLPLFLAAIRGGRARITATGICGVGAWVGTPVSVWLWVGGSVVHFVTWEMTKSRKIKLKTTLKCNFTPCLSITSIQLHFAQAPAWAKHSPPPAHWFGTAALPTFFSIVLYVLEYFRYY